MQHRKGISGLDLKIKTEEKTDQLDVADYSGQSK